MQSRRSLRQALVMLLSLACFGCASTNEPSRWLPASEDLPSDVYGGWISVESDGENLAGELIAISGDTVFLADTLLRTIPIAHMLSARLVSYEVGYGMGAGAFFGSVSTASNGWFLMLTFPMWLIGGSIAGVSRTFDPIIDYPNTRLDGFIPFARYPQGIPPGIDRDGVRMRAQRPRH
jgi:hypothetical protein